MAALVLSCGGLDLLMVQTILDTQDSMTAMFAITNMFEKTGRPRLPGQWSGRTILTTVVLTWPRLAHLSTILVTSWFCSLVSLTRRL